MFVEEYLLDPLRLKKPRRIFVNSMSDLFHENVSDEMLDKIFAVMALCPQHTFQVLTKRPERMLAYSGVGGFSHRICVQMRAITGSSSSRFRYPSPNVWLGVSVENQKTADERIPLLLQTPAAGRFVSAEPLLGDVDLSCWLEPTGVECMDICPGRRFVKDGEIEAVLHRGETIPICPDCGLEATWTGYDEGLDWVIAGGESGPGARPMHPDWVRSMRDQCVAAGVPFFFKQWGEFTSEQCPGVEVVLSTLQPGQCVASGVKGHHTLYTRVGKKAAGALLDGREWKQFPEALQV